MGKMTQDEYRREFTLMVSEVTCKTGARYDALCNIAESFLRPYIEKQCSRNGALRMANVEDDIYHDVLIALIKSCIDKFLYRDGTLNDDPEGFLKWIYTVARNALTDASKRYISKSQLELSMVSDDGEIIDLSSKDSRFASLEASETLKECFDTVLTLDSSLHIIFTWIMRAILLVRCDLPPDGSEFSESKVNALVVSTFGELTMSEIYAIILLESKKMPWLTIREHDEKRILAMLDAPYKEGGKLGDVRYSEFFMKKGPNATVSDWVNRVNMRITRAVNAEGI